MKEVLFVSALLAMSSVAADENSFTNIFCSSAEMRGDLYRIYDEERSTFADALEASLESGQCVWKDYGLETTLVPLYKFNDTQVMVSAEFEDGTWYAVTFNEYVE